MAIAPLTPVPATMHMTVLYREGSATVKYGPSRRNETSTLCEEQVDDSFSPVSSIEGVPVG